MKIKTQSFIFPECPQDAVVRLILTVEGEDYSLVVSAQVFPGGPTWENDVIRNVFRLAFITPEPGIYKFEMNRHGISFLDDPEKVTPRWMSKFIQFLEPMIGRQRDQLILALEEFPTNEEIIRVAYDIVRLLCMESLKCRTKDIEGMKAVDVRTVEIRAMKCTCCSFGSRRTGSKLQYLGRFVGDDILVKDVAIKVDKLRFAIYNHDDVPVVCVGYLDHENNFAKFFNDIFADRVREAVNTVAVEMMTEVLVLLEINRRIGGRCTRAIQTTYNIDSAVIIARAGAIEAEACSEHAQSAEPDGDNDVDKELEVPDSDSGSAPAS